MKTYVDPPDGWRYGFPKEYTGGNLNKWLVENGYPQEDVDFWDGKVPCTVSHIEEDDI